MRLKWIMVFIFLTFCENKTSAQLDLITGFEQRKATALANLKKFPNLDSNRVNALENVIMGSYFLKQKKEVLPYCKEELFISRKIGYAKGLFMCYYWLGLYHKSLLNTDSTSLFLDSAINVCNANQGEFFKVHKALVQITKGQLYEELENYYTALNYYFEALKVYENRADEQTCILYTNIARIYFNINNYDRAEEYIKRDIRNSLNDTDIEKLTDDYYILTNIYIAKNDLKIANVYMNKWKPLLQQIDSSFYQGYYENKGSICFKLAQYDSAYYYYKLALPFAEENNHVPEINKTLEDLTKAALQLGYLKEAKNYADRNWDLANEINSNADRIEALRNLAAYYSKTGENEKAYKLLHQSIVISDSLISETNMRQNNTLSAIYETDKAQKEITTLSQENDLNKLKSRQQFIYGFGALASLLFAGLYFFNRNRAKQAQLKLEMEKKEAEFQRSLADVSMSALRSQMNPHFIFNCLNSIKLYTTQNDNVAAALYLTKFSKLIRMALENSRSETVTLQSELESLELYIQMEAMRFKDKLKYSFVVDKNVDSGFIEIPPLLLQPYVENAIWHGLMHKDEGGLIEVGVSVMPGESVLLITIKDDGVGREKSALLRGKSALKHKSYGTKVTAERLELINQIYKTGASVTTDDVLNKTGEVAGTLVTIKIPFE